MYLLRCLRGNLGMEPTMELFIGHLVDVFREVRRVLRDDGTCWLNMGDTYGGSGKGWIKDGTTVGGKKQRSNKGSVTWDRPPDTIYERPPNYISSTQEGGLKPKDLVGMPWRVALALQADGWYLRSDIIWANILKTQYPRKITVLLGGRTANNPSLPDHGPGSQKRGE